MQSKREPSALSIFALMEGARRAYSYLEETDRQ